MLSYVTSFVPSRERRILLARAEVLTFTSHIQEQNTSGQAALLNTISARLLMFHRRHQKNHAQEDALVCDYPDCGKTFFRPDLLHRHMEKQ
jgi:hypothetical protein